MGLVNPLPNRLLFGTTSYVLPADLLPNVRLLAPYVDDIELILFEGEESNLPTRADVAELGRLAADGNCGFTVHLPLDVGIGEVDVGVRRRAQETCLRVVDLTLPLQPHAFVVHPELPLVYHPALGDDPEPLDELPADVHAAWQEGLGESLGRLASETGPFPLALENLQFDYGWVRPLLEEHDLGVTMDVGHLLMAGGVVADHLRDFGERLTVVHLHGIIDGRDHRQIGAFSPAELGDILSGIARTGTRRPAWTPESAGAPAPGSPGQGPATRSIPDPATRAGGSVVISLEVFGWRPTVPSLRTLAAALASSPDRESFGVADLDATAARLSAAADAVMAALPEWDVVEECS